MISEDIKQVHEPIVKAICSQSKDFETNFDGITFPAYSAKYNSDPRAQNEHVSMQWYEGVLQECVRWRKKAEVRLI